MSPSSQRQQPGSFLGIALISGLFTGAAIVLCMSVIGMPRLETAAFAILSGITGVAFIYRERSLVYSIDCLQAELYLSKVRWNERNDMLYNDSVACLVYFDVGTLSVDRVSVGLLQALRVPTDFKPCGQSLSELVKVGTSKIEAIVSQLQREGNSDLQHELKIEDMMGNELPVLLSLNYYKDAHMVEAAFYFLPSRGSEEFLSMETARKDLERFRRGIYRRESRILELKKEINQVLKDAGKRSKYRTGLRTDDTKLTMPAAKHSAESEATS